MVSGVDQQRLSLLLAVLEKRAGLHLAGDDVFVNIAGGMTVDGRPPNVRARSDAGTIEAPVCRIAMCAAPTRSRGFSSAFVSRMRTRLPPMLARAIIRTV